MASGHYRDSVIVERLPDGGVDGEQTDALGVPVDGAGDTDWDVHIQAQPAQIISQGGSEDIRAGRLTGIVIFEVVLRWSTANAGVCEQDRFRLARATASLPAGAVLNVRHRGVDPKGKRQELRFMCAFGEAT